MDTSSLCFSPAESELKNCNQSKQSWIVSGQTIAVMVLLLSQLEVFCSRTGLVERKKTTRQAKAWLFYGRIQRFREVVLLLRIYPKIN